MTYAPPRKVLLQGLLSVPGARRNVINYTQFASTWQPCRSEQTNRETCLGAGRALVSTDALGPAWSGSGVGRPSSGPGPVTRDALGPAWSGSGVGRPSSGPGPVTRDAPGPSWRVAVASAVQPADLDLCVIRSTSKKITL